MIPDCEINFEQNKYNKFQKISAFFAKNKCKYGIIYRSITVCLQDKIHIRCYSQSYQGFTQAKCIANIQTDRIKVIFIYTTPTALKKFTAFNSFSRAMFMPGLIYDIINLPPHCALVQSQSLRFRIGTFGQSLSCEMTRYSL